MATDLPNWDYWMWDDKGEFIHKYEFGMADHPDADFLWETEWDEKWVRTLFWTPEQATALAFGRSPDKVPWNEEPFGVKDMDQSSEFATYFHDARETIIEAQAKGILPSRIPALMFVQWAEANKFPFPPALADSVEAFQKTITEDAERFVRLEEEIRQHREELNQLQQKFLKEQQVDKAASEPHPKLRNNLLKALLGLAKEKYHYPKPGAARKISEALLLQDISLNEDTILGYLKQAKDLID